MKRNSFWKKLVSGMAIGVGAAIPGVSGGTIAVILNVYNDIINAISNLFKQFKKSFLTLAPVLLGVIIAIIPCIILFNLAFQGFVFGIVSLFAGLIIGSFPSLSDKIKGNERKTSYIIILITTLLIALALGVASVLLGDKINLDSHFKSPEWWFYLILIPVGFLAASALVIPGISGSMILLILGFYTPLLNYTVDWCKEFFDGNWSHFLPLFGLLSCLAIGIIIGFLFISKVMSYLLKEKEIVTYYGIIGFIIGSTITLFFNDTIYNDCYMKWAHHTYPGLNWYIEIPIGIVLLIIGIVLAYQLVKYQRKIEAQKKNDLGN